MNKFEVDVRAAAVDLHMAIDAATKIGMVIGWPHNFQGLASIEISDTAKSLAAFKPMPAPKAKFKSPDRASK